MAGFGAYSSDTASLGESSCLYHQLFRTTQLPTRANVAFFVTFGYEIDLNKLQASDQ